MNNKWIGVGLLILGLTIGAACAKMIAVAPLMNGGAIYLYDEQRDCPDGYRFGEYMYPNLKRLKGCWVPTQRGIYFRDEEGDAGMLPPDAFQKPQES